MDSVQWDALCARQQSLEDNSLAMGAKRFRNRLEIAARTKTGSTVGAARKLLLEGLQPLEQAIAQMCTATEGNFVRPHFAVKWCKAVGPDVAAYITIKAVLDGLAQKRVLRMAALDVAGLLFDELRYRRFLEQAPQLFDYKLKSFNTSNYRHRSRSLNASMRFARVDVSDLDVGQAQRLHIGIKLIDLLIGSTGLVEIMEGVRRPEASRAKWRRDMYLVATEDTRTWINNRNQSLEFLWPVFLPMLIPPLPWTARQRGGYRFALKKKHPLVRGVSAKTELRTLRQSKPVVFEALNRIQSTAWRINADVLQLVEQIRDQGAGMAGIPAFVEEVLPAKPLDMNTNDAARKTWRTAAHAVKERNHLRSVKALEITKTLAVALSIRDESAVYFPYNLDFRGRIYPIAAYLSPQGDDLSKSLLQFAHGKALGETGAVWLALHGANRLGETPQKEKLSKMTLQQRVDWIVSHTQQIEAVAANPFGNLWWADAEHPLQFYAFCCDWSRYVACERAGKGAEYVSALPCSQDGSCNGLQHFAAMLRDLEGGRTVNLVPQDHPEDLYQHIADRVLAGLEAMAATNMLAACWLRSGLVNRKLCKRPTMTFGYGSKKYGFGQQLIAYLKALDTWRDVRTMFTLPSEHGVAKRMVPQACALMSALIWDALQQTVVAAFYGMEWMQRAARAVAGTRIIRREKRQGQAVEWNVPATNFFVRQEYFVIARKQVKTLLAGKVIQPSVYTPTSKIAAMKQSNAISPNFVHSLDAAALMLTIKAGWDEGITAFACVHDSYGTVAADCAVLARCTRQAFVRLHQHDVIGDFYRQLQEQAWKAEDVPAPPQPGTLDLSGVLASDYFFS